MPQFKRNFKRWLPTSFLWRLSLLNILIFFAGLIFSGWAIYRTACFLAAGVGSLDAASQQQFNATLFNYVWLFLIAVAVTGSLFHFYLTRRLIAPVRQLTFATEQLQEGKFPDPLQEKRTDEVGQLVTQYNILLNQLQQSEQVRKKMVNDLSHEIRTPLSNINGYLQALKEGTIEGEHLLYSALYEESTRLTQMVEQIEKIKEWDMISTQTVLKKEWVDISQLAKQSIAMFQMQLDQKNIPITTQIEPCNLVIHPEGIQQVLNNLLDNAIRYYDGDIGIRIEGVIEDDVYKISIVGSSKSISKEDEKKLFNRFYRPDISRSRETGGVGLGLAITKEIIERHNGKVDVNTSSVQNEFWFTIPIYDE